MDLLHSDTYRVGAFETGMSDRLTLPAFLDLFQGRDELVVYKHMWHLGEPFENQCPGCTMTYYAVQDPAYLKARFNTNEILTSLMLVYVAQLFLDWLVRGPWRDPGGMNFPESRDFHSYAIIPEILPASGRAHWGFVFAIVAALVLVRHDRFAISRDSRN